MIGVWTSRTDSFSFAHVFLHFLLYFFFLSQNFRLVSKHWKDAFRRGIFVSLLFTSSRATKLPDFDRIANAFPCLKMLDCSRLDFPTDVRGTNSMMKRSERETMQTKWRELFFSTILCVCIWTENNSVVCDYVISFFNGEYSTELRSRTENHINSRSNLRVRSV